VVALVREREQVCGRPVVPIVMMALFLVSWSLMRQPTAGMAVTPRARGECRKLSLAIRAAVRMAPADADAAVITQVA
jgi:hypothetical protein